MNILDALVVEHAMMRDGLDQLERVICAHGSLERVLGSAATVHRVLHLHSVAEDTILLPALRLPESEGPVPFIHHQHDGVERAFNKLLAVKSVPEAVTISIRLLDALRHHFTEEEEHLFPLAFKLLGSARLSELGMEWAASRDVARLFPWHAAAPVK